MKTLQTFLTLTVLLPLTLLRGAETSAARLQKALFEEEANRNLPAAIAAYQSILAGHDEERRFAATALFRLGECYRKLAQTNEAVSQYQRLLREFPEQRTLTPLAEQNLFALGIAPASPPGDRGVRRISPQERKLIEEQIALVEKQLAESRKQIQVGVRAPEEDIPYRRTLIGLRRELASLDEPPGGPEQRKLLAEEIQLQEQVVQLIRKRMEVGKAAASSELDPQRELLALKRELVALEASASVSPPTGAGAGATGSFQTRLAAIVEGARADPQADPLEAAELARVEALVKDSPDLINVRTGNGDPPLHLAVTRGYRRVVEFLLNHGADVDLGPPERDTGLQFAVRNGQRAIVELLLDHKAKTDLAGSSSEPPVAIAAGNGFKAITELLLERGANVNVTNRAGETALHQAVRQNRREIVEVLLAHQADINALAEEGTPLMQAVLLLEGSADLARLLLDRGATPDARLPDHRTPLALAAWRRNATELTALLLTHGADPNARFDSKIARVPDNPRSSIPDQSYANVTNATPLMHAAAGGQAAVVELLLKAGARMNDQDSYGYTALYWGVMRDAREAVALLLERGADPNLRDRGGFTPLQLAIDNKQEPLALLLLDKGADPNLVAEADGGRTPLGTAVHRGSKTIVTALLDHGADLYACNRAGVTALDQASGNSELGLLLRARGASEAAPRPGFITACRASSRFGSPIFVQGTNSANHHTLLELFVRAYPSPIPQGWPFPSALQFPDLDHVRINRRDPATGKVNETTVSIVEILKAGDCSKDIPLQWGDAVEFPELDHPTSESWTGFPAMPPTIDCLARTVDIIVKGETNRIKLRPGSLQSAPLPRQPARGLGGLSQPLGTSFSPGTVPQATIPEIASFWLRDVVFGARVLRVSSDLSSIKVKRFDPVTKQPVEFVFSVATVLPYGAVDLWLQNGDVIQIPDK